MALSPNEMLRVASRQLDEMQRAKSMWVDVGLPKNKIREIRYENGVDVAAVGAQHEYGAGRIPMRSWLRLPMEHKRAEIVKFISTEYAAVMSGRSQTATALDRVGAFGVAMIKQAFASDGFGQWPPLSAETEHAKNEAGRPHILVFTGLLRNSVSWEVSSASS